MAGELPDYVSWVKLQPCMAALAGGCGGAVEAHHAGDRGLSQKAHDETCIPLCTHHHRAWHDGGPPFSGSTQTFRTMWRNLAIGHTRLRWEAGRLRRPGGEEVVF